MCGVLVSGYVAAIPIVTRAMLFLGDPLQSGLSRGWHLVPEMHLGHFFSLLMFAAVLGLGFLQPRFWCKYVCPSGAVFSLGNLFRVTERKVESTCINCNKCVEICPFDAIKPDFTTRTTDCTFCQTCGGVCPTDAIKFVERWNLVELKGRKRSAHERDVAWTPRLPVAGRGKRCSSGRRGERRSCHSFIRGQARRFRSFPACSPARERSRARVSRNVHSMWRVLQSVPE